MLQLAITTLPGPEGPFHLAVSARGVVAARSGGDRDGFEARLPPHGPADRAAAARLEAVRSLVEAALDGEPLDLTGIPLDLRHVTPWDAAVLHAVQALGWGETASYGEIARRAGSPRAARAAGGAIRRSGIDVIVPCHRVIAADGTLGGYGGDGPADREDWIERKPALLLREGRAVARRRP